MAKVSFYDVAQVLVEHNGLDNSIANEFVKTMFDIIQERLTTDQQVKVKGLGTFKIVNVEPRESINVNSGERILIEGHSKITFTPDATMKELINKPFSQFETVVLNDGVNFEEPKEEEDSEPEVPVVDENPEPVVEEEPEPVVEEEPEPVVEEEREPVVDENPEPVVDENPEPVVDENPEPVVEEEREPVVEENPEPVVEEEPKPVVEENPEPVVEEKEPSVVDEDDETSESRLPSHFKPVLIHLIYIIVVAALAGWGGYWYGRSSAEKDLAVIKVEQSPRKVVKNAVVAKPSAKPDTVRKDSVKPVQPVKAEEVKPEVNPVEKDPADDYAKYAKMDVRVRTGAYVIVGENGTEKVRKGETLSHFSRRILGEGMECYIEVFNGISADTTLREGQVIKIPKLKLKKAMRKQ